MAGDDGAGRDATPALRALHDRLDRIADELRRQCAVSAQTAAAQCSERRIVRHGLFWGGLFSLAAAVLGVMNYLK